MAKTSDNDDRLPYIWDLNWDIKTKEDARRKYASMQAQLKTLPFSIMRMQELAKEAGFTL